MARYWWACLTALALATQPLLGQKMIKGTEPDIGTENLVVQGEAMYSEFAYLAVEAAELLADAVNVKRSRIVFRKGELLRRAPGKKRVLYCNWVGTWSQSNRDCLLKDSSKDLLVKSLEMAPGNIFGGVYKRDLVQPVPFRPAVKKLLGDEAIGAVGSGKMFRKEIVFQGAAGGVLRLLYREYVDDLARPAFSQELTYDIGDEELTVAVKGARISIQSAGNSGIKYQVDSGFEN